MFCEIDDACFVYWLCKLDLYVCVMDCVYMLCEILLIEQFSLLLYLLNEFVCTSLCIESIDCVSMLV